MAQCHTPPKTDILVCLFLYGHETEREKNTDGKKGRQTGMSVLLARNKNADDVVRKGNQNFRCHIQLPLIQLSLSRCGMR
jgi:hypothetical protein